MEKITAILLLVLFSLGVNAQTNRSRAFERNLKMQKGICWCGFPWEMYYNLAPEKDMKTIKDRGFQGVNIGVEWTSYVD